MPITRQFRLAIFLEALIFLAYLASTIAGFQQLPQVIQDEATRWIMVDLDAAIRLSVLSFLKFVFLLTALAGLYFYAGFAKRLWLIALVLSALELVMQPFTSEPGWISALGAVMIAGFGFITGLLWHPEIRTRFRDHSTVGRRRLKLAIGTVGIVAITACVFAGWIGFQVMKKLPPSTSSQVPQDIALDADSSSDEILAELDRLADAYLTSPSNAGLVIGVTRGRGRERIFTARGVSEKQGDGGPPVTADTLFEIGSISKTYTALLLADADARETLKLETPLSEVVSNPVTIPLVEGSPVTLLDLATHHSGFPRLPGNLAMWRQFSGNPYRGYDDAKLWRAVSDLGDGSPLRRRYRYSNFGFSVLAHALAEAESRPLSELHADLFRRLGMTNSYFTDPIGPESPLATGHNRGISVAHWYDGGSLIQGTGSIVSSVNDQLTWLEAHLDPPDAVDGGSLGEAFKAVSQPRSPAGNDRTRIGLGWHFQNQSPVIAMHNGGTGGFRSLLAWTSEPKIGIVVLANSTDDVIDQIGLRLIEALSQPRENGAAPAPPDQEKAESNEAPAIETSPESTENTIPDPAPDGAEVPEAPAP